MFLRFFLACLLFFSPVTARGQGETPRFNRGLFVSVIQDPPVLSSRRAIRDLVVFAQKAEIQVLFVQIYYGNKAWFPSAVGDPGPYEACLKNVGEDPFGLLLREAHAAGIQVHAWLNMMSLNDNSKAPLLRRYGTGILTRDTGAKGALEDFKIDGQYFLEPGDPRVRKASVAVVQEVLRSYPELDGIQFDYLRYPDVHPVYGYGLENIRRFKEATGARAIRDGDPVWRQWKRDQVTECLRELVRASRAARPGIRVSATGCMPYARAYEEAFQDWPFWIDTGLVDFVTVMNYSPDPAQFARWTLNAKDQVGRSRRMNIGIGAYKLIGRSETFREELRACETAGAGACVVFHYGSLREDPRLAQAWTGEGSAVK